MPILAEVFVSALTSATVLGLGIFIVKIFFKTSFESWLKHQFDLKLEEAKSSFRQEEEQFKAAMASREKKLESLATAALSSMASRNQVLDKRRVEALENLWNAVIEMRPLRAAARFTESLKMDVLIDRASKGDAQAAKVQQFAATLWTTSGLEGFKLADLPDRERPFISPLVWGLFSAYRQLSAFPMAQLSAGSYPRHCSSGCIRPTSTLASLSNERNCACSHNVVVTSQFPQLALNA